MKSARSFQQYRPALALASPANSCVCVCSLRLWRLRMDFVSAAVALQQLVGGRGEKGKACE